MTDEIEDGVPIDEHIIIKLTDDHGVSMSFKGKGIRAEMSAGDAVDIGITLIEAGVAARI